jgi:DNA polymerase-3 subunit delta'
MSEKLPLKGNLSLHRQLEGRPLSHAYLFSGPVGSGRHTAAKWLAKAMVCSAPEGRPCGCCSNCRKVEEGIHPDVILTPDGADLKIDQARDLRSDAYIRPNEADRKVYLFENAGALSDLVQNVLLKLIEEGPEYAAFLLITQHAGQLLPTIRSRCEELKLTPISTEEVEEILAQRHPDLPPQRRRELALHCGGIVGEALRQVETEEDQETVALSALAEEFCLALAQGDELSLGAFLAVQEKRSRQELTVFCDQCRQRLHSGLLQGAGVTPPLPTQGAAALSRLSQGKLLELERLQEEALRRLEGNAGGGHLLGWLVVSSLEVVQK